MSVEPRSPSHEELVADLRLLRERGVTAIRHLHLGALGRAALLCGLSAGEQPEPAAIEALVRVRSGSLPAVT
jgi:hypothetical protein